MAQIQTTDNTSHKLTDDEQIARPDIERIANIQIGNLKLDDCPNLLVFPRDLNHYGDDISEGHILELQGDQIITGNIMGFIGVNNTQIDIRSRFAKEDGNDYFLHYMLQKVFAINLFDIKHTTDKEQVFDFLLYLFPNFLQKALGQGLYKKYRRFEYNDANIRGPIDVSQHIRQNIPFRGTVAYSTREHSYDNEVTQLVRHTIEYIKTKAHGARKRLSTKSLWPRKPITSGSVRRSSTRTSDPSGIPTTQPIRNCKRFVCKSFATNPSSTGRRRTRSMVSCSMAHGCGRSI